MSRHLSKNAPFPVRVEGARERQRQRFEGTRLGCNAEMGPGEVREYCRLGDGGRSLLRSAMHQLQMSARAFHRILKLARTIADLAGEGEITTAHLIGPGGRCEPGFLESTRNAGTNYL